MKNVIYLTILAIGITSLAIVTLSGCDAFWRTGDEIVKDVNDVAGTARALLESPAGLMIPPSIRLYGEIGVMLLSGLALTWQELRNRNMKKTASAIVKGIENQVNPDKATSEVKASIAEELMKQGGQKSYDRANKIIDKLKIA